LNRRASAQGGVRAVILNAVLLATSFLERNGTLLQILAAVLIALITFLLTWYLSFRNRATKTLDYKEISSFPIVTSHERPDRLKILFEDTEVDNPFITQICIENTGKQVIESDDFLSPLQIYRKDASVLEWGVVDESEDSLSGDIGLTIFPGEPERIDSFPSTLNPGDWFVVQIICDGNPAQPLCVTTRIKGQTRKIREIEDRRRFIGPGWVIVQSLLALSAGAVPVMLIGGFGSYKNWAIPASLTVLTAVGFGVLVNYLNDLATRPKDGIRSFF
jgi:hypothetical protein